jgi:hypothetical protein
LAGLAVHRGQISKRSRFPGSIIRVPRERKSSVIESDGSLALAGLGGIEIKISGRQKTLSLAAPIADSLVNKGGLAI